MITKQRKKRLQNKIQQSRFRLIQEHPFFGILSMYFQYVSVKQISSISTDGISIYFSADYLDKLQWYELDFVICHLIMHIVFGHIWDENFAADEDFHYVCDISINALLAKEGFEERKYEHLGKLWVNSQGNKINPYEITPQVIQSVLPFSLSLLDEKSKKRLFCDSNIYWGGFNDDSGEIIIERPDFEKEFSSYSLQNKSEDKNRLESVKSLKRKWKSRIVTTSEFLKQSKDRDKDYGTQTEFIERIINETKKNVIDWRKILNDFIQEQICDYSFSPPDRRFVETDFFLPDYNEKEFVVKDILFMADTSASVSVKQLDMVYSEIKGALEQFNGKLKAKLGFFDTEVTPPLPFEDIAELMNIIPYGEGGTDFCVIFEYIRNHCIEDLPSCIIIFTDGDGPYPDADASMGIPVLWIINNSLITPPWGNVVRINDKLTWSD